MSTLEEVAIRVLARQLGRAVPIRWTSALASDPACTIGIATIKIVTEEQVQAIAYGRFGEEPEVIVRLDPIGRDVTDLLPFARFMGAIADEALANEGEFRVWVPHSAALETLDVLGHRYWRNQSAQPEIVRMGEVCRIIAHEAAFPGQQLVATAADILRQHVATGQCPVEDGHLHAILAWLDPTVCDPLREGRDRIRIPASGVLPNTPDRPDDDRVDRLRKVAKSSTGAARASAEREIARILREAVLREWRILVEARAAFRALGLPTTGLTDLAKRTRARVAYALAEGHFPARRADRLALEFEQMEAGQQLAEQAALENDLSLRERARRAGGAVLGVISQVHQPRRGFKPCAVEIDSAQAVIRCRRDDKVKLVGTNVRGVVRDIQARPRGGTRLRIEITEGVRSHSVLAVGVPAEVIDQGFGHPRVKTFNLVRDRQPWIFYDSTPPSLPIGTGAPPQSPLVIAQSKRRP